MRSTPRRFWPQAEQNWPLNAEPQLLQTVDAVGSALRRAMIREVIGALGRAASGQGTPAEDAGPAR